jgi:hypothetical protein
VVDAKVKDDRRKEWDRLISEVKSLPAERQEGHDYITTGEISRDDGDQPDKTRNSISTASYGIRRSATTPSQAAHWSSRPSQAVPRASRPVKKSVDHPILAEEEWIDDDANSLLSPRDPRDGTHVRKVEETVVHLVNRLLDQSQINSSIPGSSTSTKRIDDLVAERKQMWERIDALQHEDHPLPTYSYLDPISVRQEQAELHKSLIALFNQNGSKPSKVKADIILAKVGYNLLISTSPPNITTYNILLDYFTRIRRHDLAQTVVDSFIDESRYRPNTTTVSLLLNHYSAKGDKEGFRMIVDRMRGVKGDMRIMRRPLSTLSLPWVREWAMRNKVIHRDGFLTQKMPRNDQIFEALIAGSLTQRDILSAIRFFRAALREGYHVKPELFYRIAEACFSRLDSHAAKTLLDTILRHWDGAVPPVHGLEYNGTSRYAIHQLMDLCGISVDSVGEPTGPVDHKRLRRLARHMIIASLTDSVDRFAEANSAIECIMNMKTPKDLSQELKAHRRVLKPLAPYTDPTNLHECISVSLRILKRAAVVQNRRDMKKGRQTTKLRLKLLERVEAELDFQLSDTEDIQHKLLPISYSRLSPQSKSKYNVSTSSRPSMPSFKKMTILLRLHREKDTSASTTPKHPGPHRTYSPVSTPDFPLRDTPKKAESPTGSFPTPYHVLPHSESLARSQF